MFLQTALVFGTMWTIGATLGRILAALDLQVVPHVPQPAIILAAPRTVEATRSLVGVLRSSKRSFLRARRERTVRDLPLIIDHPALIT